MAVHCHCRLAAACDCRAHCRRDLADYLPPTPRVSSVHFMHVYNTCMVVIQLCACVVGSWVSVFHLVFMYACVYASHENDTAFLVLEVGCVRMNYTISTPLAYLERNLCTLAIHFEPLVFSCAPTSLTWFTGTDDLHLRSFTPRWTTYLLRTCWAARKPISSSTERNETVKPQFGFSNSITYLEMFFALNIVSFFKLPNNYNIYTL